MKSKPLDQMTVTMALLHSWVSIQEQMPALADHDFLKNTGKNGLDDRLVMRGLAT